MAWRIGGVPSVRAGGGGGGSRAEEPVKQQVSGEGRRKVSLENCGSPTVAGEWVQDARSCLISG